MSSSPDQDATNSDTLSKTHISLNVDADEEEEEEEKEEEEESRERGMIQLELEATNINVQVESETEINDDEIVEEDEENEENEEEEGEEERAVVEENDDNAIDFTSLVEESRSTFNQANDDFVYELADNSPNEIPNKSALNDKHSPKQEVELSMNVSKSIVVDEDCIILDDSSNSNSVPDPASLTFLTSAALKNALTSMNLTTLNVSSSPNPTPKSSTSDNTRRVLVSVPLIPGQQPIMVKVREVEWNSIKGNLIRYNRVDLERMRQDEVIKHAQMAAKRVKNSKPSSSSSQKPAKKKAPTKQMNVIDLNELRQQLSSESVSSVSSDEEEIKAAKTSKKNSSSANNSASSQHKRTKSTDKQTSSKTNEAVESKTVTATASTKSSTTSSKTSSSNILDRSSSKFMAEMNKIPAQNKPKPKSTSNKPTTELITIDSSSNSPQTDDFNDVPACVTQAQAVIVSKLAKSTTTTIKKDINNNVIVASYTSKKTTVESNQKSLNEKESKKSSTVSISTTTTAKKRPGETITSKETTTKESNEEPRPFKIPRLKNREEETNGDSNKAVDVPKSSANSMKRKADEIESTPISNKEKIKQQTAKRSKPMFSGGASILEKLLPSSSSSSNSASVTARKKTTSHMSPHNSTSSMSPSSTRPGKSLITGPIDGSTVELTSSWSMSDAMTALLTPSQLPASIEQLNEIRSQFNVDLGYKHGYYSPLFLLAAFVKRMTRSPALNFVRLSERLPSSFSPEIDINGVSEPLRLQLCKLMSRSAGWINLWVMFGFDCWLREIPRGFKPSLTIPVSLECSEAKSIQWVYSMSMSETFIWYDRVMSRINAPYSQRSHIRFGSTKYYNIRIEFENDYYIESEDTSVEACIAYTLHRSHSHFDQINHRLHQTCVKEETQPEVDCTASNGAAETNDNTPATLVGPTWEMTKQNYDEAKKTINDDQLLNTIYMRSLAQKILSKPISKKIVIMKTKFVRETTDKSDRDERIDQLRHLSQPRFCNFFGSNINPENRGQMRRIDLESRNRILNDAEFKRKIRTLEKEKNVSIDCTKLFQD